MTRAGAAALVAIALTAGLALRLARLDVRPMHNDEANQAIKFGALLERGEYRYDAYDHHGPTLYYLSLPAAWLRGQTALASLDERTIRGVTAVAGAATILLLPLLSAAIGRTAVAAGAVLDGAVAGDGLLFPDVHPGIDVCLLHAGVRDRHRTRGDGRRPRLVDAGGRCRGPGRRDQGNLGHRPACCARSLRDVQVVAGTRAVADPSGR